MNITQQLIGPGYVLVKLSYDGGRNSCHWRMFIGKLAAKKPARVTPRRLRDSHCVHSDI